MDFPPFPKLLSRGNTIPALEQFADTIERTVNFGTQSLSWVGDTLTGGDETAPITMSFRHILDLFDSISVLIRQSCADPCRLLLRAALESYLYMEYILEQDSHNRGMAFVVHYFHERIKEHEKNDATSEIGKQLRSSLQGDKLMSGQPIVTNPHTQNITNLQKLLQQPEYLPHEQEYQRLKALSRGRSSRVKSGFEWYTMYGIPDGHPANLEELARHLKLSSLYEMMYRPWSNTMHGTDIFSGKVTSSSTSSAMIQLRRPSDAQYICSVLLTLSYYIYKLVFTKLIPRKMHNFRLWESALVPYYKQLSGEPLLTVTIEGYE